MAFSRIDMLFAPQTSLPGHDILRTKGPSYYFPGNKIRINHVITIIEKERNKKMKKIVTLCLVLFTFVTAISCCAQTAYTNDGLTLSVPEEFADRVLVQTPENSEKGILFSVSEIESMEVAKAAGYPWEGAGWLFDISRINEEKMHELRSSDHPGYIIFAKDTEGYYYVYYHPTDVRVVREDYNDAAAIERWTELSGWSGGVRHTFMTENEGLTPEKFSYTTLDSYLARIVYSDDQDYTVSTLEYGRQLPNGIKAADYLAPLTEDVIYTIVHDEEAPDGEYLVLNFEDIDLRYDFFFMEGKENYIRQVWFNNENELLYKAEFKDENVKASEVMNDFYHELVLRNSLGYTPDDMVGSWAEKIAGRGCIEISKSAVDGKYDIQIDWSGSAWQKAHWEMTAEATGNGAELRYENGKHSILTWQSEDNMTEEEVYTNGTGTFNLLSTYEVVWFDETEHAADGNVFVNAGK